MVLFVPLPHDYFLFLHTNNNNNKKRPPSSSTFVSPYYFLLIAIEGHRSKNTNTSQRGEWIHISIMSLITSNKVRAGTMRDIPSSPPPIKFIGSSASGGGILGLGGANGNDNVQKKKLQHLYILPVLLLEFLAIGLTKAVIPPLLLQTFGDNVYFVMGCAEFVRGLLAFVACPMFGKISDIVGRKACLLITVLGTCLPVCSLAIVTWREVGFYENGDGKNDIMNVIGENSVEHRMWIFVFLLALSGIFSSTFTLTFAYISDTVKSKSDRVSAYGLALATFGLSFTIGPLAGGYLAHVDGDGHRGGNGNDMSLTMGGAETEMESEEELMMDDFSTFIHPIGQKRVFVSSLILTVIDVLYIYFILPESVPRRNAGMMSLPSSPRRPANPSVEEEDDDDLSVTTNDTRTSISERWNHIRQDVLPNTWSPFDTLKIFSGDPFMYEVGYIAFLYYTSLWAVVSTLMLYAVKRFKLGPERLGELMAALGLSTMISEAVLVRMIVPSIGEKKSMRLGLAAFFVQCIVLGFAYEGWQLFICVLISMLANLVYPSLSSLVSSAVAPEMVGEALGAVNGIKALTEGVGPLFFGTLMTISEKSALPGWPYLLASLFALVAYKRSANLPDENDEEYISEKYIHRNNNGKACPRNSSSKEYKVTQPTSSSEKSNDGGYFTRVKNYLSPRRHSKSRSALSELQMEEMEGEDEYQGLLSEIDEMDESELIETNKH